ncbi:MAG: hypothetical protein ACR2MY_01825 [Candidatus Dormibacteria bacterium]
MDKKFAGKNIRMGVLLTLVSVMMALIAWGWTALYLALAVTK